MKRLFFPCALVLALYIAVAGGEYSEIDARRARAELESHRSRLPLARREIDSLHARIDSLQNHDEALERFARERYGFIRDGELLYRLSEPVPEADSVDDRRRRPSPEAPGRP